MSIGVSLNDQMPSEVLICIVGITTKSAFALCRFLLSRSSVLHIPPSTSGHPIWVLPSTTLSSRHCVAIPADSGYVTVFLAMLLTIVENLPSIRPRCMNVPPTKNHS
ncbi:hypothetical protein P3T76_008813 [Phytophthora citrophthora]|uniref:Uncharacterized protein n=1 Tax=Phytophthora citrophthora TaxID=4793 RepID=A0AAD9LL63_9STRA|nr:hypothetical protein P3T76_008813 [Phytophthora citrophthora]